MEDTAVTVYAHVSLYQSEDQQPHFELAGDGLELTV